MTEITSNLANSKKSIVETSRRCSRVLNEDFNTKEVLKDLKEECTREGGWG